LIGLFQLQIQAAKLFLALLEFGFALPHHFKRRQQFLILLPQLFKRIFRTLACQLLAEPLHVHFTQPGNRNDSAKPHFGTLTRS
jgi:hypothetical protein